MWRKHIEPLDWFLDDGLRNPFVFKTILGLPTTAAFYIGETAEEPLGLIYAYSIAPGVSASTAIVLWDRRASGCDALIHQAMLAVSRFYNLHKFYAHVAFDNRLAHRLVRRLGFEKEGESREALCYSGAWTDVVLYGLLTRNL